MKISCQSCQAKYTIADEKVLGKIVKIRCKKCSATIVINGNESSGGSAGAYDYASQGGGEQWTVNVADGDQRTMTTQEIADAYKSGVVTDETFCWKDGMGDWLPLREIEALYAMATSQASVAPDISHHEAADEQPTKIQQTELGSLFGGAPEAAAAPPGNGAGLFGGAAAAAPAPAARRVGGRGGGDLFSGAARAGGEEDVMTSAPTGSPSARPPAAGGDKLTGERNENSVLFSLSALTNTAPKGAGDVPDTPLAAGEGSGLIDIRALSAGMAPAAPKANKVDDIMNLAGGGAFTPSLAAPVLAAPSLDAPDYAAAAAAVPGEAAQGSNKTLLFAIIGGATLVVITLLVVFFVVLKSPDEPTAKNTTSSTTSATAPATTTAANTATATATQTATQTATASTTAAPPDTAPTATASATATQTATTTASTKPTATTTTTTTATQTATATTTAPANDAPPFNIEAAKVSLKSVAGGVQSCAKPGGPTGSGSVLVQFRANGSVQTAQVQGSPFAGTPVGACVAGRFFGARVPPFSGVAPPLTKSFSIN